MPDGPGRRPRQPPLSGETTLSGEAPRPPFAHASEAEMARILDFYEVRWEYEPHVYPLRRNLVGDVVESFSPDFFLPDLDLYVELTTLKQRLVRKKNRKLRLLRQLYPDVRIKLLYARDFRALMVKYGRVDLLLEMSGASGITYKALLTLVESVLSEDPALYASLQLSLPHLVETESLFASKADEWTQMVSEGRRGEFINRMSALKAALEAANPEFGASYQNLYRLADRRND